MTPKRRTVQRVLTDKYNIWYVFIHNEKHYEKLSGDLTMLYLVREIGVSKLFIPLVGFKNTHPGIVLYISNIGCHNVFPSPVSVGIPCP